MPTLNIFVGKSRSLKDIKAYQKALKKKPSILDFIDYDDKGNRVLNNCPLFRGWSVCKETSSETKKVATLGNCKIYFNTADGVIIVNHQNMSDNVTYNDLAIFFDGNLRLN